MIEIPPPLQKGWTNLDFNAHGRHSQTLERVMRGEDVDKEALQAAVEWAVSHMEAYAEELGEVDAERMALG